MMDDYHAVMPLTHRRKWGIAYLYQPSFCAETGIFSVEEINHELVQHFINNIPKQFRYIDICLNRFNPVIRSDYGLKDRTNYILSLKLSYDEIQSAYSENHKRNIQKGRKQSLIVEEVPVEETIELVTFHIKNGPLKNDADKSVFRQLFMLARQKEGAICLGVRNRQGTLMSSAVFFHVLQQWYYLLAGSTVEGKRSGAAHLLVDSFIRQQATTENILDFEGSDVESVAFFYRGFGSKVIHYPAIRINRLPFLLRFFKR